MLLESFHPCCQILDEDDTRERCELQVERKNLFKVIQDVSEIGNQTLRAYSTHRKDEKKSYTWSRKRFLFEL